MLKSALCKKLSQSYNTPRNPFKQKNIVNNDRGTSIISLTSNALTISSSAESTVVVKCSGSGSEDTGFNATVSIGRNTNVFSTSTSTNSDVIDSPISISTNSSLINLPPNDTSFSESMRIGHRLQDVSEDVDVKYDSSLRSLDPGIMLSDHVMDPHLANIQTYVDRFTHRHPSAFKIRIYDLQFFTYLHMCDSWTYNFEESRVNTMSKYNYNLFTGYSFLYIPVHCGLHFTFFKVDILKKTLYYYDSLSSSDLTAESTMKKFSSYIIRYLVDLATRVWCEDSFATGWTTELVRSCPQQSNGVDCGVYMCLGIDLESAGISWAQQEIKRTEIGNYRKVMRVSIQKKKVPYPAIVFSQGYFSGINLLAQLRTSIQGGGALDLALSTAIEYVGWRVFHLVLKGVKYIFWVGCGGGAELINILIILFMYLDRRMYEQLIFVTSELKACDTFQKNCISVLTKMHSLHYGCNKCLIDPDFTFAGKLFNLMGFDTKCFMHNKLPSSLNRQSLFYSSAAIDKETYLNLIIPALQAGVRFFLVGNCWISRLGDFFAKNVNVELIAGPVLASSRCPHKLAYFQIMDSTAYFKKLRVELIRYVF
jgi:Ulp1 protease family, C-terminal catalytic domain